MSAQERLGDASQVLSDREKDYDKYEDMLSLIAEYWSTYVSSIMDDNIFLGEDDVATMMALFKIARATIGENEKTADDLQDALGYMAMASDMRFHKEAEEPPVPERSTRPVTETRLENSPDWGRTEETFENVIRSLTNYQDEWDAGWEVRREH